MSSVALVTAGACLPAAQAPAGSITSPAATPSSTPAVPPPSATPSAIPIASTGAPTIPPSPTVAPVLSVRAIGPIPSEFRYIQTTARVLLIDPANKRASEVLRYDVNGQPRQVEFSASDDGRTLAVIAHPAENVGTIYIVRPESGDATAGLQQGGITKPSLSRDGKTLAYQRVSVDPAVHGVWLMDLPQGTSRRIVADEVMRVGSPPLPLAWSYDGRWLAVVANAVGPGGERVAAIDVTAGETRFDGTGAFVGGLARTGPAGVSADWKDQRLLVTASSGPLAGTRASVDLFDVASGTSRNLIKPTADRNVFRAIWRPGAESYVVLEGPYITGPGSPLDVQLRGLDGTSRSVFQSGFIADLWWSPDGSKLYAWTGGDDSTGGIAEVFSGAGFPFCLRGGSAPPCL